jgi:hypothetical protein
MRKFTKEGSLPRGAQKDNIPAASICGYHVMEQIAGIDLQSIFLVEDPTHHTNHALRHVSPIQNVSVQSDASRRTL